LVAGGEAEAGKEQAAGKGAAGKWTGTAPTQPHPAALLADSFVHWQAGCAPILASHAALLRAPAMSALG
jgi:hypothetical protein